MAQQRTANQLWKMSGTTLSFKDWLGREKDKYNNADGISVNAAFIPNKPLTDSINRTLNEMRGEGPFRTDVSNKTVLGLNKTVLLVGAVLIVGAIAFKIYKSSKKQ